MKGEEEVAERMLTEKQASQLSGTEFKAMIIRQLTELTEKYQNYRETTLNSLQTIST